MVEMLQQGLIAAHDYLVERVLDAVLAALRSGEVLVAEDLEGAFETPCGRLAQPAPGDAGLIRLRS